MADPRYESPVSDLTAAQLAAALRKSVVDVKANFPKGTGVCVFAFDLGKPGGVGYIANAQRADMVKMLRHWLRKQASQS
jgi:hypothetical protein